MPCSSGLCNHKLLSSLCNHILFDILFDASKNQKSGVFLLICNIACSEFVRHELNMLGVLDPVFQALACYLLGYWSLQFDNFFAKNVFVLTGVIYTHQTFILMKRS